MAREVLPHNVQQEIRMVLDHDVKIYQNQLIVKYHLGQHDLLVQQNVTDEYRLEQDRYLLNHQMVA